jgi:hypothetical protein
MSRADHSSGDGMPELCTANLSDHSAFRMSDQDAGTMPDQASGDMSQSDVYLPDAYNSTVSDTVAH